MAKTLPDTKKSIGKLGDLMSKIGSLDRQPFRDTLANMLSAEPSAAKVKAHAEKYPDRWAQSITLFAKMAGYSEKIVHEHNLYAQIVTMSDAELIHKLQELEAKIDAIGEPEGGETIDGECSTETAIALIDQRAEPSAADSGISVSPD